jgi:hypothetical protein
VNTDPINIGGTIDTNKGLKSDKGLAQYQYEDLEGVVP